MMFPSLAASDEDFTTEEMMTDRVHLLKVIISFLASISWKTVESSSVFQEEPPLGKSTEGTTVFHPWMNDSQCSNFTTTFAKNLTFPPIALVSYPGSGSSWLR